MQLQSFLFHEHFYYMVLLWFFFERNFTSICSCSCCYEQFFFLLLYVFFFEIFFCTYWMQFRQQLATSYVVCKVLWLLSALCMYVCVCVCMSLEITYVAIAATRAVIACAFCIYERFAVSSMKVFTFFLILIFFAGLMSCT